MITVEIEGKKVPVQDKRFIERISQDIGNLVWDSLDSEPELSTFIAGVAACKAERAVRKALASWLSLED